MYGVKLLANEFRRMSTVKTTEQREAILEHKEPGGGTRHVTECTEGAVIIILITDNCHIMLTTCTKLYMHALTCSSLHCRVVMCICM